jgi:hypothetical protein
VIEMNKHDSEQPSELSASGAGSWTAILLGAAIFLVWGAYLVLHEIPHEWAVSKSLDSLSTGYLWVVLLLPPAGVGLGWVKGFPRWSYPYASLALLFSLYLMNASTPGLRLFGFETFGRELWGLRALVPLAVALLAGLLITRSWQPARRFLAHLRSDLTLISFTLFGAMPFLILISFDEMNRAYSLPFMLGLTLVMLLTVAAYLRSAHPRHRVLSLAIGIVLIVAVNTLVPTAYWLQNGGFVHLPLTAVWFILTLGLLLAPTLAALRAGSAPVSPAT